MLCVRAQVAVYVRVLFLKIIDINTAKENFMAQVFIQLKWREPAFDGQTNIVRTYRFSAASCRSAKNINIRQQPCQHTRIRYGHFRSAKIKISRGPGFDLHADV